MTDAVTTSGWTAGALVYSGRPDPSWTVAADAAAVIVERLERLAPWPGGVPDVARLGYRGAWLAAPDGRRWFAFDGVAWREPPRDVRRDDGGVLERAILASAPPGVIPAEVPGRPSGRGRT